MLWWSSRRSDTSDRLEFQTSWSNILKTSEKSPTSFRLWIRSSGIRSFTTTGSSTIVDATTFSSRPTRPSAVHSELLCAKTQPSSRSPKSLESHRRRFCFDGLTRTTSQSYPKRRPRSTSSRTSAWTSPFPTKTWHCWATSSRINESIGTQRTLSDTKLNWVCKYKSKASPPSLGNLLTDIMSHETLSLSLIKAFIAVLDKRLTSSGL